MHIDQSPAEKRQVLFFQRVNNGPGRDTGRIKEPRAARDVAPGQCWAFDHRTLAEIMAEGLL